MATNKVKLTKTVTYAFKLTEITSITCTLYKQSCLYDRLQNFWIDKLKNKL